MGKHFRRVVTTLTPLAILVAYLLTHDVPTALDQADKSAAEIARTIGFSEPWEHMARYVWEHPFLALVGVVLLLALGAGASWLLEWAYARWKRRNEGTIEGWLRYHERQKASPPKPATGGYRLTDESLAGLERVARGVEAAGIGSKTARRRQEPAPQPSIWDVIQQRTPKPPSLLDQMVEGKIGTPEDELTRKAAARTAYEMRKLTGGIGDPIAFGARLLDEDARASAEAAQRSRRRALIAKGRDVVIRWRTSDRSQPFEIFASQDRDYLDVQPHLGDEYQRERIRDADNIIYGPEHDELRVAALLQELTRLQREWNLE